MTEIKIWFEFSITLSGVLSFCHTPVQNSLFLKPILGAPAGGITFFDGLLQ